MKLPRTPQIDAEMMRLAGDAVAKWLASDDGAAAACEMIDRIAATTKELQEARQVDRETLESPVTL
ncbi:MAG: hypothetical protein V2A73_20920 [Pseudomonadota bacterium]